VSFIFSPRGAGTAFAADPAALVGRRDFPPPPTCLPLYSLPSAGE